MRKQISRGPICLGFGTHSRLPRAWKDAVIVVTKGFVKSLRSNSLEAYC
jgi:hypothetical protein